MILYLKLAGENVFKNGFIVSNTNSMETDTRNPTDKT